MSNRPLGPGRSPLPRQQMPRDPRDRGRAQRLALFIVIMLGEVCLAHVPSRRFRVAAAGAFVIIAGAAFCIAVIERRS